MVNLYDKYKATSWQQLWADDKKVFVIYATGQGYYKVLTETSDGTISEYEDLTLSEAFSEWNSEINKHLGYVNA